jgi:hypothetical protein
MMLPCVSGLLSISTVVLSMHLSRTDYALVQDKSFKQWVKKYAQDESLFFAE